MTIRMVRRSLAIAAVICLISVWCHESFSCEASKSNWFGRKRSSKTPDSAEKIKEKLSKLNKNSILMALNRSKADQLQQTLNTLQQIQTDKDIVETAVAKIRRLESELEHNVINESKLDIEIKVHGSSVGRNGDGYIEVVESPYTRSLFERVDLFTMIKRTVESNPANLITADLYAELEKKYGKYAGAPDKSIAEAALLEIKSQSEGSNTWNYMVESIRGANEKARFLRTSSGRMVPGESGKLDNILAPVVEITHNNYNINIIDNIKDSNININSNSNANNIKAADKGAATSMTDDQQTASDEIVPVVVAQEARESESQKIPQEDKEIESMIDELLQHEGEWGSLMMTIEQINKWQSLFTRLRKAIEDTQRQSETIERARTIVTDTVRRVQYDEIVDIDRRMKDLSNFEQTRQLGARPVYFIDCIKWLENFRRLESIYNEQAEASAPLYAHVRVVIADQARLDFAKSIEQIVRSYPQLVAMVTDIDVIDFDAQKNGESCLSWLILRDEYIKLSREFGLNKDMQSELAPDSAYKVYVSDCHKSVLDVKTAEQMLQQMDLNKQLFDFRSILDEIENPGEEEHHDDDYPSAPSSTKEVAAEYIISQEPNTDDDLISSAQKQPEEQTEAEQKAEQDKFSQDELQAMKAKRLLVQNMWERRIADNQ